MVSKVSSAVLTINRLLLIWLAMRAINLFIFFVAEHSALHTEARLLVDHLCDTQHNRKLTGALVDCAQARTLIRTKSFAITYSIEKTLRTIVIDCWRDASNGVVSLVSLLGVLTTLIFTSALCLQHMYLGAQRIRYARSAYGESFVESLGFARRIPPVALVRMGDQHPHEFEDTSNEPRREKFD